VACGVRRVISTFRSVEHAASLEPFTPPARDGLASVCCVLCVAAMTEDEQGMACGVRRVISTF